MYTIIWIRTADELSKKLLNNAQAKGIIANDQPRDLFSQRKMMGIASHMLFQTEVRMVNSTAYSGKEVMVLKLFLGYSHSTALLKE